MYSCFWVQRVDSEHVNVLTLTGYYIEKVNVRGRWKDGDESPCGVSDKSDAL